MNEHIKDFEIHSFKKFQNFYLRNIGQFNLIVGDNNVGKTTLLEALLFDTDLQNYTFTLLNVLAGKNLRIRLSDENRFRPSISEETVYAKYIKLFFNKYSNENSFRFSYLVNETNTSLFGNEKIDFEYKLAPNIDSLSDNELREVESKESFARNRILQSGLNLLDELVLLKINGSISDIASLSTYSRRSIPKKEDMPYISFSKGYGDELVDFYSENIQVDKNRRIEFIKNLESFIPNIESIDVTTRLGKIPTIEVVEKDTNIPSPISTYGDGANKLFRILLQIAVSRGNRLMIDEIDTGIHFSRFKDFWRIILKAAKNYDVQLFATTHNPDCISYFNEVLEEELMSDFRKNARIFTLKELPDKSIKAYPYSFKEFEFAINQGIEIRGGDE